MTCEEVQSWLIEMPLEEWSPAVREEIEMHIKDCRQCAAERSELEHLGQLMQSTPQAFPGPGLEEKFRQMLRREEAEQKAARPVRRIPLWRNIAAAVILLATGIGIGVLVKPHSSGQVPLSHITPVIHSGDSATQLLTLLREESPSQRIKAVNYTESMIVPDQKVIAALINTLDHDKNANVRLACLYSLARFSDNLQVRDALVSSLPLQTEPIIQIVLINMLTEMKEQKAIRPLRDIISNEKTSKEVKNIAEKGLRTI